MDMRPRTVKAQAVAAGATKAVMAVCVAGAAMLGHTAAVAGRTVEVQLVQTPAGMAYFDPAGLRIAPGDTVRWVQINGFHSITAYHPRNDNHELRIPASAQPWDSDILLAASPLRGATFERTFTVPGVYDYFCRPHEMAGMVGRIVVGDPGDGPATKPFGYAPSAHWKPIPEAARRALPSIAEILRKETVRVR